MTDPKLRKLAHGSGAAYCLVEFSVFSIFAMAFWYGSTLVDDGHCGFEDFYATINCIFFGVSNAGTLQVSTTR